jgi:hypothetical protein
MYVHTHSLTPVHIRTHTHTHTQRHTFSHIRIRTHIHVHTGPFNSWNRQVYWWDGPDGQPTHWKQNDTISYNFILANYHSSMAM